jgi:hypothetical protein
MRRWAAVSHKTQPKEFSGDLGQTAPLCSACWVFFWHHDLDRYGIRFASVFN